MCVNEFSKAETHCKALHFSSPACIPIFERLVDKSIQCPYSIVAKEKRSGGIIGFRLMSVAYRDPPADEQSTDLVITDRGCLFMMEMLGLVKQIIFDAFPDVHKVLSRDLSFVLPKVQKKGVGAKMVEERLDYEELRFLLEKQHCPRGRNANHRSPIQGYSKVITKLIFDFFHVQ